MFRPRRDQQIDALQNVPLFAGLTRKQLGIVAAQSTPISKRAGSVLAREGERGREFVLIVDGTARVEHGGKTIASIGPGEFFGEISLIDGKPRTATIVADTACDLLVVDLRSFSTLLDTVPGLSKQIMTSLCARLREAQASHTH